MPNHVIVSTLGWSRKPLEEAVAGIAALDFGQVDLGIHEGWAHLNASELADGGAARVRREAERIRALIRQHQMRRVAACNVGLRTRDLEEQQRRLAAVCDLAASLEVPIITLGAAPRGTGFDEEVTRWRTLVPIATRRGVQLTLETHTNQITELPEVAARLCDAVPGLGLTLDPSHFYAGPNQGADFSAVLPYVRHVHLRDAGSDWEHIQVPAGTGHVNFGWIVSQLHARGYDGKFAIEYIDSIPISTGSTGPNHLARADSLRTERTTPLESGDLPVDVPSNIIRMRDVFVALERAAGIVRASPSPPAAVRPAESSP